MQTHCRERVDVREADERLRQYRLPGLFADDADIQLPYHGLLNDVQVKKDAFAGRLDLASQMDFRRRNVVLSRDKRDWRRGENRLILQVDRERRLLLACRGVNRGPGGPLIIEHRHDVRKPESQGAFVLELGQTAGRIRQRAERVLSDGVALETDRVDLHPILVR